MRPVRITGVMVLLLLSISCNNERREVDVSGIDAEVKVSRFEQDLFAVEPDRLTAESQNLHQEYGTFYQLYVERILNIGLVHDPAIGMHLKSFVTDDDIKEIYGDVQTSYPDLSEEQSGLSQAFKYYKYYFPGKPVPDAVTFISGLEYQNIAADSLILIGLDMYLGPEYKYYRMKSIPAYKSRNMRREYIVVDAIKNWIATEFPMPSSAKTMLDQIVYYGKIWYTLDAVMPKAPDSIKTGYSMDQLVWCSENEYSMWAHFVEEQLLYSTDFTKIIAYVGEGPFTKGFPNGSPAESGKWIGWQIVQAYMQNHDKVSLAELLTNNDAQKILNESGYKPGK